MCTQKHQIESEFGNTLVWDRLDDNKASAILYVKQADGVNREKWPEMINWLVENMTKLETVLKKPLHEAYQSFKKTLV